MKISNTATVWDKCNLSYCEPALKIAAHKIAKNCLHDLAANYLGLQKNQFEIRSNMAGIAVSGEVTLHTDAIDVDGYSVYVQIGQGALGDNNVMWRTCDDRQDYSGHENRWGSVDFLMGDKEAKQNFAYDIRRVCYKTRTNRM